MGDSTQEISGIFSFCDFNEIYINTYFFKVYHIREYTWLIAMDKRIMIVDDDPDILVFLRHVFEQQDYEVLTVDSGKDCIEELQHGFKGMVLIDIMMPFMDGWDTIKNIIQKQLHKDIVITIISAHGTVDHEKMKGLESFIYDYVTKPFDLQRLIVQINGLAGKNSIPTG